MTRSDDELYAVLRTAIDGIDPMPQGLVDRMIASIAVADVSREYALLTLMENAHAAVRGDSETTTLQFSDGASSVLLHISRTMSGRRRVDGWVDADATELRLIQADERGERTWSAVPDEQGRCAFDEIPPGLSRALLITAGAEKDLLTPQFEV